MFHEHQIAWDDDKVSRLWNFYVRSRVFHDLSFARGWGDQVLRVSKLPISAEIDVLDFGCGPGYMWEHLVSKRSRWRYTGVDFSSESIASLMARASGRAGFMGAHVLGGLPSRLVAESFDVVLMIEVVEHLSDTHLDAALSEVNRLLRPGGILVITTPNNEDLAAQTRMCPECGAVFHEMQHVRSWTSITLAAAVALHRLAPVRLTATDLGTRTFQGRLRRALRRIFGFPLSNPNLLGLFRKTS